MQLHLHDLRLNLHVHRESALWADDSDGRHDDGERLDADRHERIHEKRNELHEHLRLHGGLALTEFIASGPSVVALLEMFFGGRLARPPPRPALPSEAKRCNDLL